MLPFVAYLLAEEFHVSGVISAVTVGLLIARHKERLSEETVKQSHSVMETVIFILGGLVFIQIGLEFPRMLKAIPQEQYLPIVGCSFLIFFVALIIRMLMIIYHKKHTDKRFAEFILRLQAMEKTTPEHFIPRYIHNKLSPYHNHSFEERISKLKELKLTWKETVIIGWSGMRGIVSLAAAMSLPIVMDDGNVFPQRDKILFLTVSVVSLMLLIQGLGLPVLIKLLKLKKE
jgi:CPA1 family monovalent cation:H+ antiporter